jgi:adenosine 3'-phospho 5'-phosphosulfate transporter B2
MSEIKPVAPIYTYMAVSLSNVIATTCQYEALKYVSFPVQTLVRECRRTGVTEIH